MTLNIVRKQIDESIQKLIAHHENVCAYNDVLRADNRDKTARIEQLEIDIARLGASIVEDKNPFEKMTIDSLVHDRDQLLIQVKDLQKVVANKDGAIVNYCSAITKLNQRVEQLLIEQVKREEEHLDHVRKLTVENNQLKNPMISLSSFQRGFQHAIQVLQAEAGKGVDKPSNRAMRGTLIRQGFMAAIRILQNQHKQQKGLTSKDIEKTLQEIVTELGGVFATKSPITEENPEEGWSQLFIGRLCGADLFVEYLTPHYAEATQETALFKKDLQRVIEGYPLTGNAPERPVINIFAERTSDTPDGLLNVIVHLARLGWPIEVKWKAEKKDRLSGIAEAFEKFGIDVEASLRAQAEDKPTCACHAAEKHPKEHAWGCPVHVFYSISPLED